MQTDAHVFIGLWLMFTVRLCERICRMNFVDDDEDDDDFNVCFGNFKDMLKQNGLIYEQMIWICCSFIEIELCFERMN